MKLRPASALWASLLLTIVLAAAGGAAKAGAQANWLPPKPVYPDLDVRTAIDVDVPPTATQRRALREAPRSFTVTWDERQGLPASVIRHGGYLTAPSSESPRAIAERFLRDHADLFGLDEELGGLVFGGQYETKHNGATHLHFLQEDDGRPVYGAVLGFTLDARGRIVSAGGPYYPGLAAEGAPALTAAEAVAAAAASVGRRPAAGLRRVTGEPGEVTFENTVAKSLAEPSPLTAELVTFPMPAGEPARLAWKTVVEVDHESWYEAVVDAQTGKLLYRENLYLHSGPQGNVFVVQHPDIPGAAQQITSFAGASFNDDGWVTDRVTSGNNVNAYQDLDNSNAVGYRPQTPASGDPGYQHFDYTFTDAWRTGAGADVDLTDGYDDIDATITQLFFYANFMHDYLYGLGFDEPARNFQVDNFGRGGSGGDPVLAEAQDGWEDGVALNCISQGNPVQCANNANFANTDDGTSPRMQMYMWTPPRPFRDGSMDGDVIAHEYGHGVSTRLVGNDNYGSGVQTGAMGEGWSDFLSFTIWNDATVGEYVTGNTMTGIRGVAYDNSNLVYSDLCNVFGTGACQVHRDGQIWASTLFDLRVKLGKATTEQLVIDGMKNTPSSPSFLQARDGILAADLTNSGGANQCAIWGVFAAREMGFSATSSGDQMTVTGATDGPAGCLPTADAGGPYVTDEGVDAPLSALGSSDPQDAAGALLFEWDLDDDGQFDDATGPTPSFTAVGQDGVFTIGLRVTDTDGFADTASTTVTVVNVAPSVSLASDAPVDENAPVTVTGTISDPGWLDGLTGTIDWGDGSPVEALAGILENVRPDATLAFSAAHVYGDNGTFTATVCGFDDDTSTCEDLDLQVDNVDPTAEIDGTGSILINGVPTFLAHAGETLDFSGRSTDPGSDDLDLSWDWDDGPPAPDVTTTYLVNPPLADPFPSPSIQPRDVTDLQSHAFAEACTYEIVFDALDDDGGTGADTANVLVTGNGEKVRSQGYWQHQYGGNGSIDFTTGELECYLAIVGYVSTVFDEERDASTIELAHDVLFMQANGGSAAEQLDRQLLTTLLNFANGSLDWLELYDTDDPGQAPDTSLADIVAAAEAVRLNPASTDLELKKQRQILAHVG